MAILKHFEAFFFFFFYVKGKFYFQTFKRVMVKLASNWVFLFTHQFLVSMHKTLKMVDRRTYAHWENDQKDPRELDTVDITLSVSRMFPEQTKKGKPLRIVIPNGTEIQLSLGKSYLSLKIKASDSKQL